MNGTGTGVLVSFYPMAHPSHPYRGDAALRAFSQVRPWGGWGSNPRPADYENYGRVHRAH